MQSTVILITCQSQSMAPKRPARKGPKLMHGYTLLIGPEAWLSTMGKMRISSASTSVFYPLPYPHIRLLPSSISNHATTKHRRSCNDIKVQYEEHIHSEAQGFAGV